VLEKSPVVVSWLQKVAVSRVCLTFFNSQLLDESGYSIGDVSCS
ncbi:40325_t:CDS:1, partial [Gigaspora margarita]